MIGIFLTALVPDFGPKFLLYRPEDTLSEVEANKAAFRSLPLSSKAGDYASIIYKDLQYVSVIDYIEPLDPEKDPRETPIALGFILDKTENPVPYYEILGLVISSCKKVNNLNLSTLIDFLKQIYQNKEKRKFTFTITEGTSIKIMIPQKHKEKKGFDILTDVLWSN